MNKTFKSIIKEAVEEWKDDYDFSTVTSSAISAFINSAYTIYNGILGIKYLSLWNGSICVYYFLIALIRLIIVRSQADKDSHFTENVVDKRKRVYFITHILLILMNVSMVAPIIAMVNGQRSYTYGLIPAIAMAAYTVYRIVMALIHIKKSNRNENILILELRTINLTDTMLSVLTLQNTMIYANSGMSKSMQILSAWTSAGVLICIVWITIHSFLKIRKK